MAYKIIAYALVFFDLIVFSAMYSCGARTTYSKGFSDSAFSSASCGDSRDSIREKVGDPLEVRKVEDGGEYWTYSKQTTTTSDFELRALIFDNGGMLKKKLCEHYTD